MPQNQRMRRRIGVNAPFFKTNQTSLYRQLMVVGSSPTTSFIPKSLKTRCFQGFLFIYAYIPLWLSVKRHHRRTAKPCKISYASMAQLCRVRLPIANRRISYAQVVGSSPTTSFIPKSLKTRCFQGFLFIYAYIPLWLSVKRHHRRTQQALQNLIC